MPRYDLRCTYCGREWEVVRGIFQPNPCCPTCKLAPEQLPSRNTSFTVGGYNAANRYSKGTK